MENIPNYSNIQFTMADMERFFKDGDVQLDDKSIKKLNSIFQKCDKKDTEGNKIKGGDGQLTGKERESFMKKIKRKMPELYSQLVDFFIVVDLVDEKIQWSKAQYQAEQQNGIEADNANKDKPIEETPITSAYERLKTQEKIRKILDKLPASGEKREKALNEVKSLQYRLYLGSMQNEAKNNINNWMNLQKEQLERLEEKALEELKKVEQEFDIEKQQQENKRILEDENK